MNFHNFGQPPDSGVTELIVTSVVTFLAGLLGAVIGAWASLRTGRNTAREARRAEKVAAYAHLVTAIDSFVLEVEHAIREAQLARTSMLKGERKSLGDHIQIARPHVLECYRAFNAIRLIEPRSSRALGVAETLLKETTESFENLYYEVAQGRFMGEARTQALARADELVEDLVRLVQRETATPP